MNGQVMMMAVGLAAAGFIATYVFQSLGGSKSDDEAERKRRVAQLQQAEKEKKLQEKEEGKDQPRVLCYFGSQTGTAEGFAKSIAEAARRHGFVGKVLDLEEFDKEEFERIASEEGDKIIFCFTVATYGEGDPSDNAVQFASYLKDDSEDSVKPLDGLRYCVFGLGNKQYEHFNAMGKLVDSRLEAKGARRVYKYGEGDDDGTLQEDFNLWMEDLHATLRVEQFGADAADEENPNSGALVKPDFYYETKWLTSPPKDNEELLKSGGRYEESKRKPESGKLDLTSKSYFKTEAFAVKSIRELRKSPGPEKTGSTLHVELELPPAIRTYGTAFNLSIMPENEMTLVERLAKAVGWSEEDLDRWMSIRSRKEIKEADLGPLLPSPCTLRIALQTGCALNSVPTKAVIEKLAFFAQDKTHQASMLKMCSKDGKSILHEEIVEPKTSLVELCEKFSSLRFEDPCEFIEVCPRLAARDYTIASSSKENPRVVALTVSVVTEPLPNGREFHGVCTYSLKQRKQHLDAAQPCNPIYAFVKPSSFVLPPDLTVPVIFIGPGTGIAPMRALMQERRWLKEHGGARLGPAILFFGCRKKDEDFIYADEFDQFKRSGAILNYFVAFSRENPATKVYVQDLLKQQGEIVWEYISAKKGHVYVCGGTVMGKDVHQTLVSLAAKFGKMNEAQSKDYVAKMSLDGRLVQELWS